jgi:hypothetical protein
LIVKSIEEARDSSAQFLVYDDGSVADLRKMEWSE